MHTPITDKVPLPPGVTAQVEGRTVSLRGPKGALAKAMVPPNVAIAAEDGALVLRGLRGTQREKRQLFTAKARLRNYVRGVTEGHMYLLRICASHFPMSVAVKGQFFEVKNFIGESVPRVLPLPAGVAVKVDGSLIEVSGPDLDVVSQTAAAIEQLTRRPGYDRRIFQDGIYIFEKDGEQIA